MNERLIGKRQVTATCVPFPKSPLTIRSSVQFSIRDGRIYTSERKDPLSNLELIRALGAEAQERGKINQTALNFYRAIKGEGYLGKEINAYLEMVVSGITTHKEGRAGIATEQRALEFQKMTAKIPDKRELEKWKNGRENWIKFFATGKSSIPPSEYLGRAGC